MEIARLRQYRLNHLTKWCVAEIVAILPVLLQISLALFFAGLLILLWHLHHTVAIVASGLVGVVMLFVLVTTILPVFQTDCCYFSPPTYALYRIMKPIKFFINCLHHGPIFGVLHSRCLYLSQVESLPGFVRSCAENVAVWAMQRCMPWHSVAVPTWRGREQTAVQSSSSQLYADMIVHAYSTTMDVNYLSSTAGAILVDIDASAVAKCHDRIKEINERHFGKSDVPMPSADFWAGVLILGPREEIATTLYHQCRLGTDYYLDNIPAISYHRLLLALVATISNSLPGCDANWRSLWLLEKVLSLEPAILEAIPTKVIRHGA